MTEVEDKGDVEFVDDDQWLHIVSSGKRFITIDAKLRSAYFESDNADSLGLFIVESLNQARAKVQAAIDEFERTELEKDRDRGVGELIV